MNFVKNIKKNTSFLQSPVLLKDFHPSFLVYAIYRSTVTYFVESVFAQNNVKNYQCDFRKKKLYQTILLKNIFANARLKGNFFILYFPTFDFFNLVALKNLFENPDIKLFVSYYKSFFLNLQRLQLLVSFTSLTAVYFSLTHSIFLLSLFPLKIIQPIFNIICLYLYKLDVFLLKIRP